jgi:nucleotide sugar dehydrogenase
MIGCIGYGYVGSALSLCFARNINVAVYDIIDVSNNLCKNMIYFNNMIEFIKCMESGKETPIYFICVPTPMKLDTYECDTRIIDSVIESLYKNITKKSFVVIKSTIPIGKTDSFNKMYNNKMNVIFNPEFLTQDNAESDFINQKRTIIGSDLHEEELHEITLLYNKNFNNLQIDYCLAREAELAKLMLNSFWATKVAFANEFYDISTSVGVDYKNVASLVKGDDRIGKTHLDVPGNDNLRGFGGVCLPKDLNNVRTISQKRNIKTILLDAVWETNCNIRQDKDWEKLIGKAVSKE